MCIYIFKCHDAGSLKKEAFAVVLALEFFPKEASGLACLEFEKYVVVLSMVIFLICLMTM